MVVYRIGSAGYSSNSGEGASRYGGRWNHKGTAVIYTSQSIALCALEVLANASRLPADLSVIEIIIPRTIAVHALTISELPEGWNDPIPSVATRDLGTNWVKLGATAILSVPSSIVPRERNYLLNPNHPDFAKIRFGAPEPFQFDSRLK